MYAAAQSQPLPPNPSSDQIEQLITSPFVHLNGAAAPLSVAELVGPDAWRPRVLAPGVASVDVANLGVALVVVPGLAPGVCRANTLKSDDGQAVVNSTSSRQRPAVGAIRWDAWYQPIPSRASS